MNPAKLCWLRKGIRTTRHTEGVLPLQACSPRTFHGFISRVLPPTEMLNGMVRRGMQSQQPNYSLLIPPVPGSSLPSPFV